MHPSLPWTSVLEPNGFIQGIPVATRVFGEVKDLPESTPGVYCIVSALVVEACPDRTDLVSPGEMVYDPETRKPVACWRLYAHAK